MVQLIDFGWNQVAVAYTSVMMIFIPLLGVIIFHIFYYTRISKLSFVQKVFKWTSKEKPKENLTNNDPEELDGYQLVRSAAGNQELPTINNILHHLNQPAQNQVNTGTQ